MARAHFTRPLRDSVGDLVLVASVRLLEPGTTDPISETVFAEDTGSVEHMQPWDISDGVIDFYLDETKTLDLSVTPDSGDEAVFPNVVVAAPYAKNPTYADMVYDGSDNLTAWTEDGIACSATYDPTTGNMTTLTVGSVTRTFTYDGSGRMMGAT